MRVKWTGWAFVGPFLAVFGFALVAPIAYAIYLSLFRQQLIGGNTLVWFANYREALTDPQFWGSVRRVAVFLAVQVPIMLFFAIKWLRRAPGQTLRVLALQAGAWLASCAPVYFLHL